MERSEILTAMAELKLYGMGRKFIFRSSSDRRRFCAALR